MSTLVPSAEEEAGPVLLTIPAEMRLPSGRKQNTLLQVGPFENRAEALKWEEELARGIIEETPPRGYVETRTVTGRGIQAVLGRDHAELRIAPPGKNPVEPDRHFLIKEGQITAYTGMRSSSLINPNNQPGKMVGHDIGLYVARRISQSA